MSEISGVFLIQKQYLRSLRRKLKKAKYDYVVVSAKNKKWLYFVLDKIDEEEEEDFDEYYEENMEEIDWEISLNPKAVMDLRNFSTSFPIVFVEQGESYGWGYVLFALGEIKAGFFLDYETDEPSTQEIKDQLRMANIRELRLLGLKRTEIKEVRELLDRNLIFQDIKGELQIPLVHRFLHILGIENVEGMRWKNIGYINDPEFLKFQRRFVLRPLKRYGFHSYKTSDIGRICDGTILHYIEFQKTGQGEGQYYVNVWIRPLFSDFKGMGGRITMFPEVPTHGGEFWSEETKNDVKLVRDAIMQFILPWFEQHATPRDLINHFEQSKKGKMNKEMENWTPYEIAMVYLWLQDYKNGAQYLKMTQIQDEEDSCTNNMCRIILSYIESGQFEKIQVLLEKNLKNAKKSLKKLRDNFVILTFGFSFQSVENEEDEDNENDENNEENYDS